MTTRSIGSGLLAILLLSACGSTPGSSATGSSTTGEVATPSACLTAPPEGESPPTSSCPIAGGGGGAGSGGQPGPGGAAGGSDGTITRRWSETVDTSAPGSHSVVHQEYTAVVHVKFTEVDIEGWTISGRAEITSALTTLDDSLFDTPLGPCGHHWTDDSSASGSVDVDGGIEARSGIYQFYVNVPGFDGGTTVSVRDDTACQGSNTSETNPWPVGPITASGDGDLTDSRHISGSSTTPRQDGEDTTTWDFTLPD